jgi:hypothetical protein
VLDGLGVERNLIDSSAHHSAREIIVTHGKSRFPALDIFPINIQINSKEKKQILFNVFIDKYLLNK